MAPKQPGSHSNGFQRVGELERRLKNRRRRTVTALKKNLLAAWAQLDETYPRAGVADVPKRLRVCMKAEGDAFENSGVF